MARKRLTRFFTVPRKRDERKRNEYIFSVARTIFAGFGWVFQFLSFLISGTLLYLMLGR